VEGEDPEEEAEGGEVAGEAQEEEKDQEDILG
jgi:hypothetical protein